MEKAIDYHQILIDELQGLPDEMFPNLLQIVRLFKDSILIQSRKVVMELQNEFSEWDRLSDEALLEFEKRI